MGGVVVGGWVVLLWVDGVVGGWCCCGSVGGCCGWML